MYGKWQDRGLLKVTEQSICDQARAIRKNRWLTKVELEAIRRKVLMEKEDREMTKGTADDNEQREQVENQTERQMVDGNIDVVEGETLLDENNNLNEEEHEILTQLMEIMKGKKLVGQISFKKVDRSKLNNATKKVNRVVQYIMTNSITDTNKLIKAASVYVAKELGLKEQWKDAKKTEPWWKRRIEGDIKILRTDINILERKRTS